VEKLVKIVQEVLGSIRTVIANQEKFATELEAFKAEQQRAGKALGEAGLILQNHAEVVRSHGGAIVTLWREAGLPLADAPTIEPPKNSPVN